MSLEITNSVLDQAIALNAAGDVSGAYRVQWQSAAANHYRVAIVE
jgi:hypothetical protein